MLSATFAIAVLLALGLSVVLAFCLPVWASCAIVLAAVLTTAIGGGALLAKFAAAGAAALAAAWLWRRHARRQAQNESGQQGTIAVAIPPHAGKATERAHRPERERRAA